MKIGSSGQSGWSKNRHPKNQSPKKDKSGNTDNKGGKSFKDYLDDATKKDQGKKK